MDLLNSILTSMDKDKPPTASEQQKKLIKKQKEYAERIKNRQKEELLRFRKYVEERIGRFAKDDRPHIEFQPLDKVHRAIIHEVAEYGGFIAMSFGREDIDRHSVVYKKENAPTEDEIAARRNGDGWDEDIAKEYAERRKQQRELEIEQKKMVRASIKTTTKNEIEVKPSSNYKDKYAHLIGQEAALEAARKTETNHSYGFVPSKNKKDMRSIEQTLADIQAKKKLKLQQQQQQVESPIQIEAINKDQ
ncbi:sperm-associated antigen 7-like [Teleopsis dalmanni]|uniref:sperm-associated antigen 7-like n=1 Tax=Teleopsis dalmanni TaxID=139649 RepID=UPI0018CCBE6F|nr:sperm-associated antigen 7-like [Teleopsis dalmanni]XP_037941637.1 sperm-associated antigen 7-like [Teleopsis dalmanni]